MWAETGNKSENICCQSKYRYGLTNCRISGLHMSLTSSTGYSCFHSAAAEEPTEQIGRWWNRRNHATPLAR